MDGMTDIDPQHSPEPAPARRAWIIEGAVLIGAALVVRAVIRVTPLADGPLRHWYAQAALVAAGLGLFWAGHRLIGRGYGSRQPGGDDS